MQKKNNCSIIIIGNELLAGKIADKHTRFIANELSAAGVVVRESRIIGDDLPAITAAFAGAVKTSAFCIVSGGLGPTSDDLTRKAISQFTEKPLCLDDEVWRAIRERFKKKQTSCTNKVQAMIPEGFEVIPNNNGTACGMSGRYSDTDFYILPGPPRELRPMFIQTVLPKVSACTKNSDVTISTLTAFLIPESLLEERLQAAAARMSVTWSTRFEDYRIVLTLYGGGRTQHASVFKTLVSFFGQALIVEGEVDPLIRLTDILSQNNDTVFTVESCTGGLLGVVLTSIAGSSKWYAGGITAYSNSIKNQIVGVADATLEKHGAVSRETAEEMAKNAAVTGTAHAAVSITGIAGPSGGSEEKPVGTVWIGVSYGEVSYARCFQLSGSRDLVRRKSVCGALIMLYSAIFNKTSLDSYWKSAYI